MTELAAGTGPDGMCPVCRSGEAVRQTSCTPRVGAFSCDRCDTRWAITVVSPPSLVDRIASAMAARSVADEVITVAPAVPDDDSEPRGYYIGECGHRAPLIGPICYVGPCEECGVGAGERAALPSPADGRA